MLSLNAGIYGRSRLISSAASRIFQYIPGYFAIFYSDSPNITLNRSDAEWELIHRSIRMIGQYLVVA